MWRLVVQGVATLEELETHWNIDDVLRANGILDMRDDFDKHEASKQ